MKLYLVRHGETPWNVEDRCQGFSDIELNEKGQRQALAIAAAMAREPVTAVYASPLKRALATAQPIAEGHRLELVTDSGLMEVNQGDFEGLTIAELRQHEAFLREWFLRPATLQMPNGESMQEAQDRAWAAIERMRDTHPEGVVVAVGHNLTNVTILCRAIGLDLNNFRRLKQSVACYSTLEFSARGCTLTSLNEQWHLRVTE